MEFSSNSTRKVLTKKAKNMSKNVKSNNKNTKKSASKSKKSTRNIYKIESLEPLLR